MFKYPLIQNHLVNCNSPYLIQHAHNPVNWYPWSEEALALARQENKPILLSIGYSACHWCHVMAHESFEDQDTAKIMNEYFINIKVDREERPDLDKIYQTAHQLLVRRGGGWPLTVFLTPEDHMPFFLGTYFPPQPRHGLPAFKELLTHIATFYRDHRSEINQQNKQLEQILQQVTTSLPENKNITLDKTPIFNAQKALLEDIDLIHGGFGDAPKFPHPTSLDFLLSFQLQTKENNQTTHAINLTLTKMVEGGIYDQLGGGFFRYSVDERWEIPHFEKMLYDNAQLLPLYAQASLIYGGDEFVDKTQETAEWAIREMQDAKGGFYSTLDADSEGHEGKYYIWTYEEIASLLEPLELEVFSKHFNLHAPPNFEGKYHLHVVKPLLTIAKEINLNITETQNILKRACDKLYLTRQKRIYPGLDTKILTAWNGLMIKGMTFAGLYLNNNDFIYAAQRAVDFLRDNVWLNQRLLACYRDSHAYQMAYLDDYAFLCEGLLTLLQAKWRDHDLQWLMELIEILLNYFWDDKGNGFFFTAKDHENLIQRPKTFMDEALPSGNAVALQVIIRLGYLLAEPRYLQFAEQALCSAWPMLLQAPQFHCALLGALQDYLDPPTMIILRGPSDELHIWQKELRHEYNQRRLIIGIPQDATHLPPSLTDKVAPQKGVNAYICQGYQCNRVVNDLIELKELLVNINKDRL